MRENGYEYAAGQVLVVAEKPSVGRAFAEVLGAKEKKDGYMEGNGYTVTWCIGHLVEPLEPEGYDERYRKWRYEDLPIIPGDFKGSGSDRGRPGGQGEPGMSKESWNYSGESGRKVEKSGNGWRYRARPETKKQYDIVARLLNDRRFSEVVCATDAGREGETIFRKVYNLSGSMLPIKRLWISSMEDSAIREGFDNLRPGEEYENLYQAGICREKADWLVGMNGTRLFTELYGYAAGNSGVVMEKEESQNGISLQKHREKPSQNGKRASQNGIGVGHVIYHIGRVQTPTLAMVVEREESIRGFVKEPYYTVHIRTEGSHSDPFMSDLASNNIRHLTSQTSNQDAAQLRFSTKIGAKNRTEGLDAVSDKYKTREEATELADLCLGQPCYVERISEEEKTRSVPKLYDLTSLQRDANRLFGFTALQTSEYTQSLYEKKLCTYPRTDSRYLTDDMGETAGEIIEAVSRRFFPVETGFQPKISALLNSKKVSDHHAIIPTMEIASVDMGSLSDGERKILLMIANRLICAVSAPFRYKKIYVQLVCNHNFFEATGTKVIDPGFHRYEDMLRESFRIPGSEDSENDTGEKGTVKGKEADERRETDPEVLESLYEGMEITPYELSVKTGFTVPPKPFTEDTLLKYMENAGTQRRTANQLRVKPVSNSGTNDPFTQDSQENDSRPFAGSCLIFDEDVERKGLGTPATRAEIIDKLCKSGYLKREKKNLRATALGERLIHLVPQVVKSVELSVEWENNLTRINRGEMDPADFMADIEKMVRELVEEVYERRKIIQFPSELIGVCPHCQGEIVKGRFGFYCRNRCGMKVDTAYGKQLTEEQIRKLLKGESIEITLRSRKGKEFDAILKPKGVQPYSYEKDGKEYSGFQYDFDVSFPEKKQQS